MGLKSGVRKIGAEPSPNSTGCGGGAYFLSCPFCKRPKRETGLSVTNPSSIATLYVALRGTKQFLMVLPQFQPRYSYLLHSNTSNFKTIFYPPECLDFDATDIPEAVKKALIEAISCHSVECYAASALMVRRMLEELCKNRGLRERI